MRQRVAIVETCLLILLVISLFDVTAPAVTSEETIAIAKTDSGYNVTLDGQDCARFTAPELKGGDSPKVQVDKIGHGWQHVRMTWDVPEAVPQIELNRQFVLGHRI